MAIKTRRIVDNSYFRDIFLVVGTDAELDRWLKRKGAEARWSGASGKYLRLADDSTHYVMVSTKSRSGWKLAVLAHEVLHLTFAVLGDAGIQYREGSEEAFTYYFQAMFAKCLRHLPR